MPTIEEIRAKAQEKALEIATQRVENEMKKLMSEKLEEHLNDLIAQEKSNLTNTIRTAFENQKDMIFLKVNEEMSKCLSELNGIELVANQEAETCRQTTRSYQKEMAKAQDKMRECQSAANEILEKREALVSQFVTFEEEAREASEIIEKQKVKSFKIIQETKGYLRRRKKKLGMLILLLLVALLVGLNYRTIVSEIKIYQQEEQDQTEATLEELKKFKDLREEQEERSRLQKIKALEDQYKTREAKVKEAGDLLKEQGRDLSLENFQKALREVEEQSEQGE